LCRQGARCGERESDSDDLPHARTWKAGFTLIELLVVIAIISLLSSVVLASLSGARESARDTRRLQDMRQVRQALEMYYNDNGQYPSTGGTNNWRGTETSNSSVNCYGNHGDNAIPGLAPDYMQAVPKDPNPKSNNCYLYTSNGTDYKFLIHRTMEACQCGDCPKQDPRRDTYCASSIYTPDAKNW